jgi:hypothetical protein
MVTIANTTNPPRLHNLPVNFLAYEIGDLDRRIMALEAEKEAAREEINIHGVEKAEEGRFNVSFLASIRQSLDTVAMKVEIGQQWLDDHSMLTEMRHHADRRQQGGPPPHRLIPIT